MNRREFLAAAGGVALVSAVPAGAAPKLLERRIPSTGELLPAFGLGTSGSFEVGETLADRAPLLDVLREFRAAGATLIDTAPMYGPAESVVGDLLTDLQLQRGTFLATKVLTTGADAGRAQVARSMERLHTQRLDLLQVHNLVDWRTQLGVITALKTQGAVRYTGLTHYRTEAHGDLEAALGAQPVDFAQFNYSIVTRAAEQRLLPFCRDRGIGVIVNRAFEDGKLFATVRDRALPAYAAEIGVTSWAQFFLKFVLSHPAVTCVIVATAKPAHLRDNLQGAIGPLPDTALRERMAGELA